MGELTIPCRGPKGFVTPLGKRTHAAEAGKDKLMEEVDYMDCEELKDLGRKNWGPDCKNIARQAAGASAG